MMTTDPMPEPALSWMKRGAAAHLRKPFEPEYLIELCARARRERALLRAEELLEARTRELRESEERYRAITEDIPVLICRFLPGGEITYVNDACCRYFDKTSEALVGSSFLSLIPEEDRETVMAGISALTVESPLQSHEHKVLAPDGETRWQRWTNHALFDDRGEIAAFQSIGEDISERKQMEEKLKEMSFHDSLTGLYNRNFFEEEMTRLSNGRYNPVGIVVCDLDGLKFINDTLGHQSGDQMLIQVADILRQNFRSSDIIARIGGDEFVILFTETDSEIIEQILQRLRQSVQDYNNTEPEIPLSLSTGYALDEGTTVDMQALFREADNLMYREKNQRV